MVDTEHRPRETRACLRWDRAPARYLLIVDALTVAVLAHMATTSSLGSLACQLSADRCLLTNAAICVFFRYAKKTRDPSSHRTLDPWRGHRPPAPGRGHLSRLRHRARNP